ncbi:hypothetical protein LG634_35905 [Streptomyces bambusae]|uniref:hypothetical protein n=1 Tax=Streptomyces bambusae TaxID=1550616 RepID=UPI001CFFFD6A|nr:hypothetical protein [Streptomyces bambusae]MCB5170171.1 hypothetical protein [Streptomyces bambusae]
MFGRRVRLAAVLVAVVLALTGFSSGGSKGGGSKGGSKSRSSSGGSDSGSGGGCSSSKKKNGKHSDSDFDDAGTVASGGSGSGAQPTGGTANASGSAEGLVKVEILKCAGPASGRTRGKQRPRTTSKAETDSTLRVTSTSNAAHTFVIEVDFMGGTSGTAVDENTQQITLDPYETREIRVPMVHNRRAKDVKRCEIDEISLFK